MTDIHLVSFDGTALMLTAAMCIAAIFVSAYTVRRRIQPSQVILGIFAYFLVLLLQSSLWQLDTGTGLVYALYIPVTTVLAQEIVRFLCIKYVIRPRFSGVDAAIGFAIGFAGLYLVICAVSYFNYYALAREFISEGAETFASNMGEDADAAADILRMIAQAGGWAFLLTGVSRIFFLIRQISISVLLWYAMDDSSLSSYYILLPLGHFLAMLPDGLYQAGYLTQSWTRDVLSIAVTAVIALWASRLYNKREDQASHYRPEFLRARRHR